MRRIGEIRVVPNAGEEILGIARDLVGMLFCVGVMLMVTLLAGRWP